MQSKESSVFCTHGYLRDHCLEERRVVACVHGVRGICTLCYDNAVRTIEALEQHKQAILNKPRKTITRINLTEYRMQVIVHTDTTQSIRWWHNSPIIPPEEYVPHHCYLNRKDATKTYLEGDRTQTRLATIHTCKDHMVVVDWTA